MLKMSQVNYIRDLSNSGYRIAEISKKLKLDRKTVRKYLSQEDFSPTPPVKHSAARRRNVSARACGTSSSTLAVSHRS